MFMKIENQKRSFCLPEEENFAEAVWISVKFWRTLSYRIVSLIFWCREIAIFLVSFAFRVSVDGKDDDGDGDVSWKRTFIGICAFDWTVMGGFGVRLG